MGFVRKILVRLGSAVAVPAPAPPPGAARVGPLVDVVAQLEKRAAAKPQKPNGRSSVVDRLKLLDIDSSFAAREELATPPGCQAPLMTGLAQLNLWLHTTVLARVAANRGNVPQDLLD